MLDLEQLPKIELHCHLDGSLSREYVEETLGRKVELSELQVESGCKNLKEYLEKFDLPLECLQTEKGLKEAGYDFIRSLAKENVRYVEVRFAPLLSTAKGLDCEKIMGAVLEGLEEGKRKYKVEYNVIACAMRHHSYEENLRMFDEVKGFYKKGLCALDLAGNEAAFPMKNFEKLFAEAKKMGYEYTIHAGECGSVDNVVDSVLAGAKRVGHGIALSGNPKAIALCKERKTGIEMCPTSNLQTKAVKDIRNYPMREFLDEGLMVTINTDNRTVSGTTLTDEIRLVKEHCNITDEDIITMMKNAVEVSFADEALKERLRKEWSR